MEVTFLTPKGRIAKRLKGVDPAEWVGRAIVVKRTDREGISFQPSTTTTVAEFSRMLCKGGSYMSFREHPLRKRNQ